MGSVINSILTPISLIDRNLGNALRTAALSAIGFSIGGPIGGAIGSAIGQGLASTIGADRSVQKPETAEFSIKIPRPARVRAYGVSRLYGTSIAYESIDGATIDVWAFHDGRASAIIATYLNDNAVTVSGGFVQALPDKSYQSNHVLLGYSFGETPGTAFAEVTARMPEWDANHRGDGVVCGYLIKLPDEPTAFLETYPQGDSVSLSLVGQWAPVFDPRDPAQDPYDPATWVFSENAVLALIHYLMVERGYDWEFRFAPQLAKLITAINIADEDVPLAAGGSEKRYRTAVAYKATDTPSSVVAGIVACFDGWFCLNESGEVVIYAGASYTPTVSIGPTQIVSFRHQINVQDENVVNRIGVTYVSALHDYATVEGEAWTDEDDIIARGRENASDLGAAVPSHTQGRRLAKISMARTNASDRGTVSTIFGCDYLLSERFINLTIVEAGAEFFSGVAEIVSIDRNEQTGGVTFEWVKADPNAYAWNPATEDGEPAPVTNRYVSEPLDTPVIVSAEPDLTGMTARVRIIAEEAPITPVTWFARWRDGTGAWNAQEYDDTDPGPLVELLTVLTTDSEFVQVAVRYKATDGRLSDWSEPVVVSTAGFVRITEAGDERTTESGDTRIGA